MYMKFYNYCCVFIGNENINVDEIFNFVENEPNTILYKESALSVNTFVSSLTHNEIGDYFNNFNLNYFLFDIDANSSFNLSDVNLIQDLMVNLNASEKTKDIIDLIDLNDDLNFFTEEDIAIENMSKKEMLLNINNILDKGYDKMDDYDKRYMHKLYEKYNS
jgi:hypothetical protein